jgi:Na+/H+ antiporter NhaA
LAVALAWAYFTVESHHFHILECRIGFEAGGLPYAQSLHHWINDGLMT